MGVAVRIWAYAVGNIEQRGTYSYVRTLGDLGEGGSKLEEEAPSIDRTDSDVGGM